MFPGRNEGKAGKKVEPISQFLVPKTSGDEKNTIFLQFLSSEAKNQMRKFEFLRFFVDSWHKNPIFR